MCVGAHSCSLPVMNTWKSANITREQSDKRLCYQGVK